MLSSTFEKLSPNATKKLLVLAITSFLLAVSCMLYFDSFLKPNGIISFELTKTLCGSKTILKSWELKEGAMQAAEWSLWFDYIFIFTYVFLSCLVLNCVRKRVWKTPENLGYRLGTVLISMVVFAGFLDMVENFALLQLFYGDLQQHWTLLAFSTASVKFIIIILAILYAISSPLIARIKNYS
jgi:hypothetical protein